MDVEHPLGGFHRLLRQVHHLLAHAMASASGSSDTWFWPGRAATRSVGIQVPVSANSLACNRLIYGSPGERTTVGGDQPPRTCGIGKIRGGAM